MNFIRYLFEKPISSTNLSKSSIKKLARKAGVVYLKNDLLDVINTNYLNNCSEYINKLKKISSHRRGKIIRTKDLKLLLELTTKLKQQGGNYDGYCDNNVGQCSDSIMCGGSTFNNIVPRERFIKILKSNKKSKIKISKNLANNLQTIIEKNIHNDLIRAKYVAKKNNRKMINLGDLLVNL